MNVLIFNYEYPPLGGGGGVAAALIAEELARDHRVHVLTSRAGGLAARETVNGVEVHRVPVVARRRRATASLVSMLSYPPAAWLRAARLFRRESFDIVNGHFAVPTGIGSVPPAKLRGCPHVLTIHGGDIFDPSKRLSPHRVGVFRAAVGWVMRNSDMVIAQSENTRSNAYRYYRYAGPIEIIPLGIRIPEVPPADRVSLGLPQGVFLGVTVGRLVPRKGLDRLLRALTDPGCREAHLAVIGSGPEKDRLEALASELGVRDRVVFTGFVEETVKWQMLRAADAYLSASLHEGFGLVYLEGMAAGLPVVAPDHGGQTDFLEDGRTGFVVPAEEDGRLAGAIARLAREPEERRRMAETNRERVRRFEARHCAERYERAFLRLLENGKITRWAKRPR